MSEYVNKPAAQSSFVPPAVQIQTRPFAPPQVQPSAAPQNAESSQAERDLESEEKQSSQKNLYFTDLSFSGNDNRGSTESVTQRKWQGIVQRYKEGSNTAPDPIHEYTPVRGSSHSIMQRKLDEMQQRVKEGGNAEPDPNYEYTPIRGSSQSVMQRKHQEMVQRYKENQAKTIQAKLAIGAVGDKYEQEADRVAAEVVQKINAPESVQREEAPEENELQMKPAISSIQREAMPEEENELQMKPAISSVQREPEEEDELRMKPLSEAIQREGIPEEEEELQAKSLVQRRDTLAGGEASADLESSIQSAKGSGQSLDPNLQAKMGEAMGANFSGVKVHTDAQSDQLNQSIQARAFTTGQDVFFRQGEYDPSSRGGQELIAHELTHVVQQNGGAVQRSAAQTSIQRDMDFSSTDLGGSLSKSAKIAKFFGNESTFSKIRALLNKYEIADASQQYSILMQLKPLVESWLSKHPVKTKNDNAKKVSLMRLLNAIVEEMQNVKLKNQNLTSDNNSDSNSVASESSVTSSSVSDAPEKTIEEEKVTLDKIASDDLSENLDGGSETIEVEAEDIVSEAELADPKPDDTVDVAKLQSDYLKDLNSGKFKFLTTDVALSKDLTKARSEGEELASDYNLTEAEHTAIRIYTGRDYSYMNPVLANNDAWLDSKVKENTDKNKWSSFGKDTLDDKEREQIKEEGKRHSDMAVMGLKKLPDENRETYRGLGLSKKDFDDQYQTGKELSFPSFTSTSTNKAVSADFARSEAKGGKVGILILLQVTKGKDINKLSIFPGEGEILLLPGAKFKIGPITPPSSPGEFYTVKANQTS